MYTSAGLLNLEYYKIHIVCDTMSEKQNKMMLKDLQKRWEKNLNDLNNVDKDEEKNTDMAKFRKRWDTKLDHTDIDFSENLVECQECGIEQDSNHRYCEICGTKLSRRKHIEHTKKSLVPT